LELYLTLQNKLLAIKDIDPITGTICVAFIKNGNIHQYIKLVFVLCFVLQLPGTFLGVPQRQPHRRSGLATLPVGAIP